MEHYVNIMLDSGFKAVFGDKQVMMDFINAALYDEREVADLNYMDKEISPELSDGRTVIFDLLCEDTDGAKFIVEMQNCPQNYFFNRGFYYICRMISRQGEKGPEWKYACSRYMESTCWTSAFPSSLHGEWTWFWQTSKQVRLLGGSG